MSVTLEQLTERAQIRRDLPPPSMRRALRKAAGVSLSEVAAIIGVTRQAVALWEGGDRTPRGTNLDEYARVLRELRRVADSP